MRGGAQARLDAERAWKLRLLRALHAALGLVLVVAGVLKLGASGLGSGQADVLTWLTVAFSTVEVLGGLWLLSGLELEATRPWAVAAFVGFWAVSAFQAVTGKCSCGCLGSLTVSPWLALLFDLAAVVALLRCDPAAEPSGVLSGSPSRVIALASLALFTMGVGGCQQSAVVPEGVATLSGRPLQDAELIVADEPVRSTEPSTDPGKAAVPVVPIPSFKATVRTDSEGHFRLPTILPGLYSVTLLRRSTRMPLPPMAPGRRPLRKMPSNLTARQKRLLAESRHVVRGVGPEGDGVTVWLDVSECGYRDLKIDYK